MPRDIVVIGGSAGGVEAITTLLRQLPADLPACVFVVCHMLPNATAHLVDAFNAAEPLVANTAEDGEEITPGMIYVAPPDRHLLVKRAHLRITRGPRENRWPAIDPLFRSAAVAYGARVIGIVLTGLLDDGTAGLQAVKRCGGVAIVQDPEEAPFPDMPKNALANVDIDHCLAIGEMPGLLQRLVREPVAAGAAAPGDLEKEARIAEMGFSNAKITDELGTLATHVCPECSGPLWRRDEPGVSQRPSMVEHHESLAREAREHPAPGASHVDRVVRRGPAHSALARLEQSSIP